MKNIYKQSFYFISLIFSILSYGCTPPDSPRGKDFHLEKFHEIQCLIAKINPDQPDQVTRLQELVIEYRRSAAIISASLETRWGELAEQIEEIRNPAIPLQMIPAENSTHLPSNTCIFAQSSIK